MDSIIQLCAGVPYDFDKPWPFWFFIGKILSKAFYGTEDQLDWFNATRVRDREFVAFAKVRHVDLNRETHSLRIEEIQTVEVDFLKPRPGESMKVFWKPARGIIHQGVVRCTTSF